MVSFIFGYARARLRWRAVQFGEALHQFHDADHEFLELGERAVTCHRLMARYDGGALVIPAG